MGNNNDEYIPALKYAWLTPFFDFIIRSTMRESTFKRRLVQQAQIERNHRVLDLGCGTGTLTILIKKEHPSTQVAGLDGDPKILQIARAKVANAGLEIDLDLGMAFGLPYPDCSFDRILSSLLFHHLNRENKMRTLEEAFRTLKPGGMLHIADLGRPSNALMFLVSLIMSRLEETSDNIQGLLLEMMKDVGFEQVEQSAQYMTVFGTLSLYQARKPRKDSVNGTR